MANRSGVIAAAVVLSALLLLCGISGVGVFLLTQRLGDRVDVEPGTDTPPPPIGASPEEPDDAGADPGFDREAAVRSMRKRYRPGPDVTVEGILPAGLSDAVEGDSLPGTRAAQNPWIVVGAAYHSEGISESSSPAPALERIREPDEPERLTVLPNVPARVGVRASATPGHEDGQVAGLAIAFDGYPGHFFVPASADTELGPVQVSGLGEATVHFGIAVPVPPGGAGPLDKAFEATMAIAAVDEAGRRSPLVRRALWVLPVGTGDVRVTLTMERATDLDLYVTDPAGVDIYYGSRNSASGGVLDLDANAACSSNLGINNEHVFWSRGGAPAGTYSVRVANFEICIAGELVGYRVTVENCGEVVVLRGDHSGEGSSATCTSTEQVGCDRVLEFDVSPCVNAP